MSEKIVDIILDTLRSSGADDYEVEEIRETGWEFYFIRHKLDQNRAKDIETVKVKVYKKSDDGKFLGSATGEIPPTANKGEVVKLIDDLVYQATLIKNPYYELNGPKEAGMEDGVPQEVSSHVDIEKTAKDFIETFNEIPETETEDLNSYEIFVSKIEKHFINSRGIDQTSTYPTSLIEVVTNARDKESKEEIELYRLYRRGTCDKEALTRDVTELLTMGKDKLKAVSTPPIKKAPLIMSTADAVCIFDYFFQRMNVRYKYQGLSDWEIGKAIEDDIKGDKVTINAVPILPNSPRNFPFDEEGAVVKERCIMKEHVPENFWGDRQFSQYLNITENSLVYNYIVHGGSKTSEELRKGPYLEVVEFSGFDCDPMTGDIAGEIRLGYYHDGEKITKVSGGSVSGSMREFVKEMYLSNETRQYSDTVIPAVIRLEGATVTGIE